MKNKLLKIRYELILITFLVLQSCVSFKPGLNEYIEKTNSSDIQKLFDQVYKIEAKASSGKEVLKLIEAFKKIEQVDPHNYLALWKIGNYNILMGAAYAEKRKDKKYYYRQAIKYCEKAMGTNHDFLSEVQKGKEIFDACNKLTINEIDAMGYWYTARFYYFKECLRPLGRLMNTGIVIQNNKVIERIDELNPDWAGGGNYFSRALYYLGVPEKFGGSKKLAGDEFSKAVDVGPDFLVNRWGRAKYFYNLIGNDNAFKSDLEWVISQDPEKAGNTYPWNVYFQKDAKKMLSNLNN